MFRFIIIAYLNFILKENNFVNCVPSKRIIGGRTTDIHKVPYQVSLQYNNHHICGASIIRPAYILTAAHCVQNGTIKNYSIRAGSMYHMRGGVVRKVLKITCHPNYDNKTVNFDAAFIELETPLPTTTRILAVPLATKRPQEGDLIIVTGWGGLKEKSKSHTTLQTVTIPIVSNKICKKIFSRLNVITDAMICAGYINGGKDSCQGDSGGPAVFDGKLVGIISWGAGCGRRGIPGVYTNVALIKPWIESLMP